MTEYADGGIIKGPTRDAVPVESDDFIPSATVRSMGADTVRALLANARGPLTIAGVEFEQLDADPGPHLCEGCGRWIPCRHCDDD